MEKIIEKYKEDVKHYLDLHNKYTRAASNAGAVINETKNIFAQALCEHYKEFVGKKVRITFAWENNWSKKFEASAVIGYLQGFYVKGDYSTESIYPDVAKVKKDGSPSLNHYSEWDIKSWSKIQSIEVLTD